MLPHPVYAKLQISNHSIVVPVPAGVSGGSEEGVGPEPAGEEGGGCCCCRCPFSVTRESGSTQYGRAADPDDDPVAADPDDCGGDDPEADPEDDDPLMETHSPGGGSCTAL